MPIRFAESCKFKESMDTKPHDQSPITVLPATIEQWVDIEVLFAGHPCWCQYWRVSAPPSLAGAASGLGKCCNGSSARGRYRVLMIALSGRLSASWCAPATAGAAWRELCCAGRSNALALMERQRLRHTLSILGGSASIPPSPMSAPPPCSNAKAFNGLWKLLQRAPGLPGG